jgi:hypothetical protein
MRCSGSDCSTILLTKRDEKSDLSTLEREVPIWAHVCVESNWSFCEITRILAAQLTSSNSRPIRHRQRSTEIRIASSLLCNIRLDYFVLLQLSQREILVQIVIVVIYKSNEWCWVIKTLNDISFWWNCFHYFLYRLLCSELNCVSFRVTSATVLRPYTCRRICFVLFFLTVDGLYLFIACNIDWGTTLVFYQKTFVCLLSEMTSVSCQVPFATVLQLLYAWRRIYVVFLLSVIYTYLLHVIERILVFFISHLRAWY